MVTMDKPLACIQIGSDIIKLLIGYEINGVAVALYHKEVAVPGAIKEGRVVDEAVFLNGLSQLTSIKDDTAKISAKISECLLVLPPFGLQIFQNDKTTNIIAQNNEIAKIDISNVVSLVKKEPLTNGLSIVDIIPDQFVLDTGERYVDPPLGKKSSSLTILAKIHALPSEIPQTYERLFTQAGLRIKKKCVSTYCLAKLHSTYDDLPTSYVMVDIGGKQTTVSLIGKGSPYASTTFFEGGDDLTAAIAEAFGIGLEEAGKLRDQYGYDKRECSYSPAICQGSDAKGPASFKKEDLNAVIESFYEGYGQLLTNAVAVLLGKYKGAYDALPIVLTGGGAALFGSKQLLTPLFPTRELFFARPRSIGARDYGEGALLGIILAASKYTGSLEDNYRGMGSISRAPSKAKKTSNPEVDAL
jgi:cell division protein FtsA